MKTVPYFLVLIEPIGDPAAMDVHADDHVAFVDRMIEENVVLLGGGFETAVDSAVGAYLLHTPSRAVAQDWAARDPLMASGACRARVIQWDLVGVNTGAIDPRL